MWGHICRNLTFCLSSSPRLGKAQMCFALTHYLAETGCRKVYAEVFEWQKNPMEAKETIGDGGGRKYANRQSSNQNRQDAIISRVSAVQNSTRGPRWKHWRSGGWKTLSVQAANEWQPQLRLLTTSSGGTCMTYDSMHAAQKPTSKLSLSRLTKKVIWARCGDDKSF